MKVCVCEAVCKLVSHFSWRCASHKNQNTYVLSSAIRPSREIWIRRIKRVSALKALRLSLTGGIWQHGLKKHCFFTASFQGVHTLISHDNTCCTDSSWLHCEVMRPLCKYSDMIYRTAREWNDLQTSSAMTVFMFYFWYFSTHTAQSAVNVTDWTKAQTIWHQRDHCLVSYASTNPPCILVTL